MDSEEEDDPAPCGPEDLVPVAPEPEPETPAVSQDNVRELVRDRDEPRDGAAREKKQAGEMRDIRQSVTEEERALQLAPAPSESSSDRGEAETAVQRIKNAEKMRRLRQSMTKWERAQQLEKDRANYQKRCLQEGYRESLNARHRAVEVQRFANQTPEEREERLRKTRERRRRREQVHDDGSRGGTSDSQSSLTESLEGPEYEPEMELKDPEQCPTWTVWLEDADVSDAPEEPETDRLSAACDDGAGDPGDFGDEFGAVYKAVLKDGNCVFRAIAVKLFRDEKHHRVVRRGVVNHVVNNWPTYAKLTRYSDQDAYRRNMKMDGLPGGAVEVRAAGEAFYHTVGVVQDGVLEVLALGKDPDPIVLRRTGASPAELYDACISLPPGGWKRGDVDMIALGRRVPVTEDGLADQPAGAGPSRPGRAGAGEHHDEGPADPLAGTVGLADGPRRSNGVGPDALHDVAGESAPAAPASRTAYFRNYMREYRARAKKPKVPKRPASSDCMGSDADLAKVHDVGNGQPTAPVLETLGGRQAKREAMEKLQEQRELIRQLEAYLSREPAEVAPQGRGAVQENVQGRGAAQENVQGRGAVQENVQGRGAAQENVQEEVSELQAKRLQEQPWSVLIKEEEDLNDTSEPIEVPLESLVKEESEAPEEETAGELDIFQENGDLVKNESGPEDTASCQDSQAGETPEPDSGMLPEGSTYTDEFSAVYKVVPQDSNSIFRALAQGLFDDEKHHQVVRTGVLNHVLKNWEPTYRQLTGFADTDAYRRYMNQLGSGGAVEARAAGEGFYRTVAIVQDGVLEVVTQQKRNPIVLRRTSADHYDVCVTLPLYGWKGSTADTRRLYGEPNVNGPQVGGPKVGGPTGSGPKVGGPTGSGPKVGGPNGSRPKVARVREQPAPRTPKYYAPQTGGCGMVIVTELTDPLAVATVGQPETDHSAPHDDTMTGNELLPLQEIGFKQETPEQRVAVPAELAGSDRGPDTVQDAIPCVIQSVSGATGESQASVSSGREEGLAGPSDLNDEFGGLYKTVRRDGNCVFRALAVQLFKDEKHHPVVRRSVVNHVANNWSTFAPLTRPVTLTSFAGPDAYRDHMNLDGARGGAAEVRAAGEAFYRTIGVVRDGLLEVAALSTTDDNPVVLRKVGEVPDEHYDAYITLPPQGWKGGKDDLVKLAILEVEVDKAGLEPHPPGQEAAPVPSEQKTAETELDVQPEVNPKSSVIPDEMKGKSTAEKRRGPSSKGRVSKPARQQAASESSGEGSPENYQSALESSEDSSESSGEDSWCPESALESSEDSTDGGDGEPARSRPKPKARSRTPARSRSRTPARSRSRTTARSRMPARTPARSRALTARLRQRREAARKQASVYIWGRILNETADQRQAREKRLSADKRRATKMQRQREARGQPPDETPASLSRVGPRSAGPRAGETTEEREARLKQNREYYRFWYGRPSEARAKAAAAPRPSPMGHPPPTAKPAPRSGETPEEREARLQKNNEYHRYWARVRCLKATGSDEPAAALDEKRASEDRAPRPRRRQRQRRRYPRLEDEEAEREAKLQRKREYAREWARRNKDRLKERRRALEQQTRGQELEARRQWKLEHATEAPEEAAARRAERRRQNSIRYSREYRRMLAKRKKDGVDKPPPRVRRKKQLTPEEAAARAAAKREHERAYGREYARRNKERLAQRRREINKMRGPRVVPPEEAEARRKYGRFYYKDERYLAEHAPNPARQRERERKRAYNERCLKQVHKSIAEAKRNGVEVPPDIAAKLERKRAYNRAYAEANKEKIADRKWRRRNNIADDQEEGEDGAPPKKKRPWRAWRKKVRAVSEDTDTSGAPAVSEAAATLGAAAGSEAAATSGAAAGSEAAATSGAAAGSEAAAVSGAATTPLSAARSQGDGGGVDGPEDAPPRRRSGRARTTRYYLDPEDSEDSM